MSRPVVRLLVLLSSAAASLCAVDVSGSRDHPLVPRYEGAEIVKYDAQAYGEAFLPVAPVKNYGGPSKNQDSFQTAEGRVTRLLYRGPAGRSGLEILRNYEMSLKRGGFSPVYTCAREACGPWFLTAAQWDNQGEGGEPLYLLARRADGTQAAVLVIGAVTNSSRFKGGSAIQVTVVEPKAMESRMAVVETPALARGLATQGRVALYAIHFDFDQATLRPESRPQLEQVAKYLKGNTARVFVVGHTDGKGGFEHNQDLSRRRAEAVVAALAADHGVDRARLTPVGAGMVAPIATNRTEDGAALNRRVEVVERLER